MSKGLKALEIIKNASTIYVGCASNIYTRYSFECKDIEKELKAFEIIKENIKVDFWQDEEGWYVRIISKATKAFCTLHIKSQEEFDLLKEVLDYGK